MNQPVADVLNQNPIIHVVVLPSAAEISKVVHSDSSLDAHDAQGPFANLTPLVHDQSIAGTLTPVADTSEVAQLHLPLVSKEVGCNSTEVIEIFPQVSANEDDSLSIVQFSPLSIPISPACDDLYFFKRGGRDER